MHKKLNPYERESESLLISVEDSNIRINYFKY